MGEKVGDLQTKEKLNVQDALLNMAVELLRRNFEEILYSKPRKEPEYLVRFTAEVLEDGRITIPSAIRKKYNVEKGDLLELGLIRITK